MIYTILHLAHDFFVGPGNCVLAIPPLLLAALIGAGSGVLTNQSKKNEADEKRKYEAETARLSPWTGMKSEYVANPNLMGDVLGGALTGMSFGSQFGGGGSSYKKLAGIGPVSGGDNYSNLLATRQGQGGVNLVRDNEGNIFYKYFEPTNQ